MTKIAKTLGAVYLVRFKKISLCEHRVKTMLIRRTKNV